jgi:hypothetical protein
MERNATQKEILLMTGTSFSSRNYTDKTGTDHTGALSERERLEEACWNGLLKEILPEIFNLTDKKLYLWQIREADAFIELELGEAPPVKENQFSLDPYSFLQATPFN